MKKVFFISFMFTLVFISSFDAFAGIVRTGVPGTYIDHDPSTKVIRCLVTTEICYYVDQIVASPGKPSPPGGAQAGLWIPSNGTGVTNIISVDSYTSYDQTLGNITIHEPELTSYSEELNETQYLIWLQQFED